MSLMSKKREDLTPSEGVVELERGWVICPGCGQQVEAVASDGRVRGYCAVARRYVDFQIETQRIQGHIGKNPTAKIFASGQDPDPDEVVRDYLAGDKTIVIQLKHGISPGKMYRILRSANVKLRMTGRCQG